MAEWYVAGQDGNEGPFDEDELAQRQRQGQLSPQTLVWQPGMEGWRPVSQTGLASLITQKWEPPRAATWGSPVHIPPPVPTELGPPPSAPAAIPPWQPPYEVQTNTEASNGLSTAAIICGVVAVFFFPIVFGPVAIALSALAFSRKEARAGIAMGVAVGGTIVGFIFGLVVWGLI